jgi:uncharacterized membrane protein
MVYRIGERRADKGRSPLWLWPAVTSMVALGAGAGAGRVRLPTRLGWLAWPGGTDAAVSFLQMIAGSVITVMTLTFSVTVVALQLASQQFSPRLLRDFVRDRVIKAVLAVLLGTLVFAATVLRGLNDRAPLPDTALLSASVMAVAAVAAVLAFVTHMTRVLRVDTMMRTVHEETDRAIECFYPAYGDPRPRSPRELNLDTAAGVTVHVPRSGFVRMIDVAALVKAASRHEAVIRVEARPGDHVVLGTPLATVWSPPGETRSCAGAVTDAVEIGYERTVEQDAAFGFRQLTDIAVKALSPAVNDPVTAAHAVGHLADLLVKLMGRRLGATLHQDRNGVGRVVVPDRDLPYYLDNVCGPIRRYGRAEPTVLIALLRMLRDGATAVRDDDQRAHLGRQTDLIVAELDDQPQGHDTATVRAMADRVRQAVHGDIHGAYADRSGETRSI